MEAETLRTLPGFEIFEAGRADIEAGRDTPEAAALQMASQRLASLDLALPAARPGVIASHHLYELLRESDPPTAHARFNAMSRRLSSFIRAVEHARAG